MALAYVYFEDEPGQGSAAHLMTRDRRAASRQDGARPRRPASLQAGT
jgi:hypothetical protein